LTPPGRTFCKIAEGSAGQPSAKLPKVQRNGDLMDYSKLKPHPLAALFPKYGAGDLKELAADIKANGLQQKIVLLDGQILDGVNRWQACMDARACQ
jgi:ParB-like chromosome segregation protein Spo0J